MEKVREIEVRPGRAREATKGLLRRVLINLGLPGSSDSRIYLQRRRCWFDPWVEEIPWRREWQPTPVFLLGESNGQRSLIFYSP